MKYYLFIDNFRGFSRTSIPITDVNFLVGENSTGKTSVLGLLKLLSSPRFLFSQDFSDEDVGFTHFSDMVSAHSENQSCFHIGFAWEGSERRRSEKVATGFLLTFVKEEGLPLLSRYTFCRGQEKVSLRFGKGVYYRADKYPGPLTAQRIVSTELHNWVNEHSGKGNGYRKLVMPAGFPSRIPLVVAMSLLLNKSRGPVKATRERRELLVYQPEVAFPLELIWLAPMTCPRFLYQS